MIQMISVCFLMSFMLFICLIMLMCHLQFACSFMKESRRFLQTVLVQEAEEETVTLLRKTILKTFKKD